MYQEQSKVIDAGVIYNSAITGDIMMMVLRAPEAALAALPGQFINIYPKSKALTLPRPISICDVDDAGESLTIVYAVAGSGTEEMSKYAFGDTVRISTPLGTGFDVSFFAERRQHLSEAAKTPGVNGSALLVGGGLGVAPLVFLSKELYKLGVRTTAVLGFKKDKYLIEHFRDHDCRIMLTTEMPTEDAFVGDVIDCLIVNNIREKICYACGPVDMLRSLSNYIYERMTDAQLQISMEERMGCGYGACVGCAIKVKVRDEDGNIYIDRRKVCSDGPVFMGNEVVW